MLRTDPRRFFSTIEPYIVQTLAFSPDGSRLASVDGNGDIKVWNFQDSNLIYAVSSHGGPEFQYSADGRVWVHAVVPPGENSKVTFEIHDATTGQLVRAISTQWPGVVALRITSNDLLASGCDDWEEQCVKESVHVWSLASGELKKSYPIMDDLNP